MPEFSQRSTERLNTCHLDLVKLFRVVVVRFDCTIIVGHRDRESQEEAYSTGHTRLRWPQSLHNQKPSLAIDVAPWKRTRPHVDWQDLDLFRTFGGYVLGVASQLDMPIRWGGDWDGDWDLRDQTLIDLPHFELVDRGRNGGGSPPPP